MATGARADLWPRDARSPHGLMLRVGVTDQPPSIRVARRAVGRLPASGPARRSRHAGPARDWRARRDRRRRTGPWAVALAAGPARDHALTRRPAASTPHVQGRRGRHRWARWLPHLDPGSAAGVPCWIGNTGASRAARIEELGQLIDSRRANRPQRVPGAVRRGGRRRAGRRAGPAQSTRHARHPPVRSRCRRLRAVRRPSGNDGVPWLV